MILSIHIPKTGGSSFRFYLQEVFGPRLMLDYGDVPEFDGVDNVRTRQGRRNEILSRVDELRQDIDVIHGHYLPGKYEGLFAATRIMTFVRDPYQHAISGYLYVVRDTRNTPALRTIRTNCRNVADFVEMFPNHQSLYLSGLDLAHDLDMIALTEEFDRGVALFQALFNITKPWSRERRNVNPDQTAPTYDVADDIRQAVNKYRPADVDLYHSAKEHFRALAGRYGL